MDYYATPSSPSQSTETDERMFMNPLEINWRGFLNWLVKYTQHTHDDYGNHYQERKWIIILMKPFFIILSTLSSLPIVMVLCGNTDLPLYVVVAIVITVAGYLMFMQKNGNSQLGNQIIYMVADVKNEFISTVGNSMIDHFYMTINCIISYSSIKKISLWNIMLIRIIVVYVFGIAVKLWIKDKSTTFMCLNITVSFINFPMVANLLWPPLRAQHSVVVCIWLTTLLVILIEKPASPKLSYLLMHYHYSVNLLVFTIATFLEVILSLYQLYDQYSTTEASDERKTLDTEAEVSEPSKEFSYLEKKYEQYIQPEAPKSNEDIPDISFVLQHRNIPEPDDEISEPSKESSNLEKRYDQYIKPGSPKSNEDIPEISFVLQPRNIPEPDNEVSEPSMEFSNLEKMYEDENFRRCFGLLAYLFPIDYEYEKNDIIQLWMADGFTQPSVETNKLLEDAANVYFDAFSAASIFQSSHSDGNSRPRYKLNHSILHDLHKLPSDEYCRIESGKPVSLSENTLHTSFICDSSDSVAFEALYQSKKLSTLLLVHAQRYSSINRVPYVLFLELPLLRALDLSGTNITELPSSVGNLKQLRLLNLSKTLVRRLPDSLCSIYLMQTIILRDCSKLVGLPKGMRKLVNLRHLDLDIASLLISMPPGIGDLIELQTLSAFIVGKDDRSHITELKHMANLRGSLGIMMLENISNAEEAKEAALDKKKYLERLELQWTELQDGVDEVLQHLQPHENLKELQIVGYGGAQFPGWIGNPYFSKLVTVTLHNCSKCEVLPSLGKLPLLGRLQISEMHAVKTIGAQFCGREIGTPHLDLVLETVRPPCNGFLRLNNLRISRMPALEKWCGMEEGDFSLLRKLSLSRFAKLTALPELTVLKTLQELEISLCPVLQFLPKKSLPTSLQSLLIISLPTSLQSLLIISCPLLEEQCRKEGQEWGEIPHIPSIWIDNQQIL